MGSTVSSWADAADLAESFFAGSGMGAGLGLLLVVVLADQDTLADGLDGFKLGGCGGLGGVLFCRVRGGHIETVDDLIATLAW